jgi:integrase/recombinase XerC
MLDEYKTSLQRRRLSPNTVRLRVYWMEKFAKAVPDLAAADIDQMEEWLDRRKHDWSANTQATAVASLRSFYRWATVTGRLQRNPAAELAHVRVHKKPSRITPENVIIDALHEASLQEQAMLLLGAECGLRVSEIAALSRSDRDGEWLTIVGKGNVTRTVHVSERLGTVLDAIEAAKMRWGHYFPGKSGGHAHPSTIWRHISRLTGMNPHALRHRAGTTVYRKLGKDLRVTQEFLGHARPETTAIYVHVERDDLLLAGNAAAIAA